MSTDRFPAPGEWIIPPPLMGCDIAAVQKAAAAALDEARACIAGDEMQPNILLSEVLYARYAGEFSVHPPAVIDDDMGYVDTSAELGHVVGNYAWFLLGAACATAAPTLPDHLHLSPEFLTDGNNLADGTIEALIMCAAAGVRADIEGTEEHRMVTRYADTDEPVPAGMVETRTPGGRRVFLPADIAPAALLTAAAVRADTPDEQVVVTTAAAIAAHLDAAGIIDVAQTAMRMIFEAERQRDAAHKLADDAFAMLARVYDTVVCAGTNTDDTGCSLVYVQTTAGQINHRIKATRGMENFPWELNAHRPAADVWDGHSYTDRAERMAAVALGTGSDLTRELLHRGGELTLQMVNGDPPINDPDNPDPGTPDYYLATIVDSDGNQIATGSSEYSHLIAITSMELDTDRHARGRELLDGEEPSNEPPF